MINVSQSCAFKEISQEADVLVIIHPTRIHFSRLLECYPSIPHLQVRCSLQRMVCRQCQSGNILDRNMHLDLKMEINMARVDRNVDNPLDD